MDAPKCAKIGMSLGFLGGIATFVGFASYGSLNNTQTFVDMAYILLISVMFFAAAGAFRPGTAWTAKGATLMCYLTLAVVVAITATGLGDFAYGLVEAIIAILMVVMSYDKDTQKYISQ